MLLGFASVSAVPGRLSGTQIQFAKSGYIVPALRFSDDTCSQKMPGSFNVTSTLQVAPTVRIMSAKDVTICAGGNSAPSLATTFQEMGWSLENKRTRKSVPSSAVGEPAMRSVGKYVRSHPRHFRQQSDYTICAGFEENLGWRFLPHGPVFGGRGKQDYVWKFNFPSSERIEVLRRLDEYNLNEFSLFDSEETLLETMWFREHVLKNLD